MWGLKICANLGKKTIVSSKRRNKMERVKIIIVWLLMLSITGCETQKGKKYIISNSYDLIDNDRFSKLFSSGIDSKIKSNIYMTSDLMILHENGTSIGEVYYKIETLFKNTERNKVIYYKKLVDDLLRPEMEGDTMFRFETVDTILRLPFDYPPKTINVTLVKKNESTLVKRARIKIFTDSREIRRFR